VEYFKYIFDIPIYYWFGKMFYFSLCRRGKKYELHIIFSHKGIKDCEQYKDDWFMGKRIFIPFYKRGNK
jgi:hypothetical protein